MNQSTHTPTLAKRCRDGLGHEQEAWCLFAAVQQGTWEAIPGVNHDTDNDGFSYSWKIMRCGCIAVVGPFPALSVGA